MHRIYQLILAVAGFSFLSLATVAEDVEIYLINKLDGNLNHYCLDMLGFQDNANPEGNLQTHTCYSYQGQLAVDQKMPVEEVAMGKINLYSFDRCARINGTNGGSTIGLAECSDDDEMQKIMLTENGQLIPEAAPTMCFTSGTSSWRGGRDGNSPHQIRTLNLQPCSDEALVYQRWGTRTGVTE
ncbi:MAG: RICIN domain-containing protein [Porticoccaceae bacterium]|nr:RICIN domain-containing protein [Porticoccaceae bacterium]